MLPIGRGVHYQLSIGFAVFAAQCGVEHQGNRMNAIVVNC
jgi:hypothetical protein